MNFHKVPARVTWLVLSGRRVAYRRIGREIELDTDALEQVRRELIQIKRWAVDRHGEYQQSACPCRRPSRVLRRSYPCPRTT